MEFLKLYPTNLKQMFWILHLNRYHNSDRPRLFNKTYDGIERERQIHKIKQSFL
jgi:hypothetical protein